MSLKRKDAMRSKRNRQAFAFSDSEHEKINILIDKVPGPPTEAQQEPKDRLQEVRQMVSEVTVIMKDNLEKVVEREGKLDTLSVRTKELEASSQKNDSEEQIENTEIDEVKLRRKSRTSLGKGQLQGKDSLIKREDGTSDKNRHFMKADMKSFPSDENSQDKDSMDRTTKPTTTETKEASPILQCYTSATGTPSPKDTKTTSASSSSQDDRSSETFPEIQQEPTQSLKQSNEQAASVFPVEIDFYSFHKSTEREPLQRHNAMRSRKNRSAVLFTETEQAAIANHVERSKSDTLPEARDRRKRQPVSDEVRQQVQQAKTTMEDNAAKVQKTETVLDSITLNVPSQVTKCRSLEDLNKDKGASAQKEQAFSLSDNVTSVKKENSSIGTPSKIGGKTSSDAEKSTHHKKKKKQPPSSTDEPESKIAYVKKKAKRAKVFFKEKLTDHNNITKNSKEYRANDGNNTAVFYTDESISTSVPKQPQLATTHQEQQPKQQPQQQQQAKESHLDALRGQVQEVTNIMKSNVDEISKRGEKLEELETRSGRLEDLSNSFASTAASIQKKMKRRNRKVICVIASIITVILLIVTVVVVVYIYG